MHQSLLLRIQGGFDKVTDNVIRPDNDEPTILVYVAKEPSGKTKPSVGIPNIRLNDNAMLGNDQESCFGTIG